MRILHLCLSNFFIDNVLYQENELVRKHVEQGHDVLVMASTETLDSSGNLIYVEPREYVGSEGAKVRRIPYRKFLPAKVMRKLRMHPRVYAQIEEFAPDVMIFHGTCGWEVLTAARYAKKNPKVSFFIDSHEDFNNSARTFGSRNLLHRPFYAPLIRSAYKHAEPILCISTETIDFVHSLYGIPKDRLELYPLGGNPLNDSEYDEGRASTRRSLGVGDEQIVFVQTGKFDERKRLLPSLDAFSRMPDPDFRLFLCGVVPPQSESKEIQNAIDADKRISFLGWKSPDELIGILAASDVYVQPGTQSVTMQNSMCQRCALVIDDVPSHQMYVQGNGFLTKAATDLEDIFATISRRRADLPAMRAKSHQLALELLDYRKLANRFFSEVQEQTAHRDRDRGVKNAPHDTKILDHDAHESDRRERAES